MDFILSEPYAVQRAHPEVVFQFKNPTEMGVPRRRQYLPERRHHSRHAMYSYAVTALGWREVDPVADVTEKRHGPSQQLLQ